MAWALRSAASSGLRVAVRSGGHSWYGNCLRDAGMLIDLSQLTDIAIDGGAMIAAVGPAVTGRELDAALVERDLFVPVGHCGTVGLDGFALGGGYGWNSRSRGPACLNIRAIDVVLANGELVHAADSNHPELLWAARGSGPGFFGVVTRFHFELCPRPRMLRMGYVYPLSVHDEVLSWALDLLPTLPAEVEASARVGYSNIIGEQAVTLTGLAFAPDGAATGPAGLLEPLGSCPVVDRALRRFSVAVEHLPDLHDRGNDGIDVRWDVDGIWTQASPGEIIPAAAAAGLRARSPAGAASCCGCCGGITMCARTRAGRCRPRFTCRRTRGGRARPMTSDMSVGSTNRFAASLGIHAASSSPTRTSRPGPGAD